MESDWERDAVKQRIPEMRPRRRPELYQHWQLWNEMMRLRQKHMLRHSAITRGKSNLVPEIEESFIAWLTDIKENRECELVTTAHVIAPCAFEWLTSLKGLGANFLKDGTWRSGGSLASQLLAQIDDIAMFDTVSKLWRWCGYAVIDGKAEHYIPGEPAHYSRLLKSTVYLVGTQFIKAQTSPYIEVYYEEKQRQRELHPVTECRECEGPWDECTHHNEGNHKMRYNDGHIDARGRRKMVKLFLAHLWDVWRRCEGLPVSEPYVFAIGGHDMAHKIEAPTAAE